MHSMKTVGLIYTCGQWKPGEKTSHSSTQSELLPTFSSELHCVRYSQVYFKETTAFPLYKISEGGMAHGCIFKYSTSPAN